MERPFTPRRTQPLSSFDNHTDILGQQKLSRQAALLQDGSNSSLYKHSSSTKSNYILSDDHIQKENRPPIIENHLPQTPPRSVNRLQVLNNNNSQRKSISRPHPKIGGKTISSSLMNKINHSENIDNNQKQRTEQRMSAEQLKLLSRRIDPSLPVSPLGSPSKPVLPAIFTNNEEDDEQKPCRLESFSSSLYQTCIDLWPSEPTLGDFASDNIKNLTDLLKVRLSQAKYRILAQLENEEQQESQGKQLEKMYPAISSAANILRDDVDYSTWPTFKKHTIHLSTKRSRVFACVSGNGQRLFRHRDTYLQQRRLYQQQQLQQKKRKRYGVLDTVSLPPPSNNKKELKRKRSTKSKSNDAKSPRSDGRFQASQASPVTLEDGSQAYVCTPCNKKYKTRNGLAYHLDRCVHISTIKSEPIDKENISVNNSVLSSQSAAKPTGVLCVCDHPTDDKGMMVQCDECQLWLHLDCLGTNDSVLDDIYHCPRCIEQSKRAKLVNLPKSEEDSTNYISNIPTDIKSSTIQQQIWSDFDLAEKAKPTTTINKNDVNMWGLSTADIPSLLYSDAMPSTLDDDLPYLMDLPSSDLSPHDLPPTDWFQFANFDDDFHCDDSQTTTQ